jgi:N-acetylglutamate synthase-like GNAT family acetyltransferase
VTPTSYRVRRAVVDDRDALVALWETMKLPAGELEKRLTEFQVAVNEHQEIVGALGIRLASKHGQLHNEAFTDFAQADSIREALWERMQSVATNHGLVRLWTTESAPFWSRSGFAPAGGDELKRLPNPWEKAGERWLTLKLRDDPEEIMNVDQEFAMFMEAEKLRSRQMMDQAKMLKLLATLLAIGLFLIVISIGAWMAIKNPSLLRR